VRRLILGVPLAAVAILASAFVIVSLVSHSPVTTAAARAPKTVAVRLYVHPVANIPVLAWHQIIAGVPTTTAEDVIWNFGHDCKPTAAVCDAKNNDETVSVTQFSYELGYLKKSGYQSVTAAQYQAWAARKTVALPAKPILLTVDDGTLNSYVGTTPVLRKYGFNVVTFIVSQFALGAGEGKQPYAGWNATWAQLLALPAAQWSFAFHAGARGHNVTFPDNPDCTYYYPCQLPTETAAAYQARVSGEITTGRKVEKQHLGARMNTAMWAVPWNDIAQQKGLPVSGSDPARWLAKWAASQFPVIFIQDPPHNGYLHERYRLEIHGTWSEAQFQVLFMNNVRDGFFDKA
jgi:hypothetical protein